MPDSDEFYITPREAFRGVYLDFESLVKEPPALLGWACEFEFEQVVLDGRLASPAKARELPVRSVEDAVHDLADRCRQESRVLIGYSEAEKSTIAEETSVEVAGIFKNARGLASRWINRLHPEAKADWDELKLRYLLEYLGFPWPRELGYQKATKKIRYVTEQAEKKDTYEDISPGGKRHWTNLLKYNRIDTLGLRDLTMRAAAELAVAQDHRITV